MSSSETRLVGGGYGAEELNGNWSRQYGSSSDKTQMRVPDRILVSGQEQHVGSKALPRELQLENVVMPHPDNIFLQTPPRSITLSQLSSPQSTSGSYPYMTNSEGEETLVIEQNETLTADFPNGSVVRLGNVEHNNSFFSRDSMGKQDGMDETNAHRTWMEIERMCNSMKSLNNRVRSLEEDNNAMKEKERYVVIGGVIFFVYKAISWLFRSKGLQESHDLEMENNKEMKNTLAEGMLTHTIEAFKNYKIDSHDFLDQIEDRFSCPICSKSRKFFCYSCYVPMPCIKDRLPSVNLPIEILIVKHRQEIDGKSTAIHGVILSPNVKICTYPNLPDTENAVLIFPSDDAVDAVDLMKNQRLINDKEFQYKRVIFIDSTWNQSFKIRNDEKIKNLPKVKLNGIESLFWRYQRGNPITHLATIEAVYHFCRIYHDHFLSPNLYNGEYDNLLFFFRYMFNKIRNLYDPKTIKAYATRPHLQE